MVLQTPNTGNPVNDKATELFLGRDTDNSRKLVFGNTGNQPLINNTTTMLIDSRSKNLELEAGGSGLLIHRGQVIVNPLVSGTAIVGSPSLFAINDDLLAFTGGAIVNLSQLHIDVNYNVVPYHHSVINTTADFDLDFGKVIGTIVIAQMRLTGSSMDRDYICVRSTSRWIILRKAANNHPTKVVNSTRSAETTYRRKRIKYSPGPWDDDPDTEGFTGAGGWQNGKPVLAVYQSPPGRNQFTRTLFYMLRFDGTNHGFRHYNDENAGGGGVFHDDEDNTDILHTVPVISRLNPTHAQLIAAGTDTVGAIIYNNYDRGIYYRGITGWWRLDAT